MANCTGDRANATRKIAMLKGGLDFRNEQVSVQEDRCCATNHGTMHCANSWYMQITLSYEALHKQQQRVIER